MHLNSLSRINLFLIFLMISLFSRALTIDGYDATANDRFENDPNFIADEFNLSGIAISSDGRWATLIAPNVFITAHHYPPALGQSITFYQSNDPNGNSITRTVATVRERIGTSDLYLCTLDLPIPEGYAVYSYATETVLSGRYRYLNQEVYHFGKSPGTYATTQDIAVGKNIVDGRSINQIVLSPDANGPTISCTQDTDSTKVDYETMAQGGDSGAPLFWDEGGNSLRLIGISWFITETPSTGFSAVGDHSDDIETFLDTYSNPYQPLAPETFTASRIDSTRIDLSWTDVSAVEVEYILERKETADDLWTEIATLSANSNSYSDTSAPDGDVYYRLYAQNDTASDPVSVSVLTPYSLWADSFDWGDADQTPSGDANSDGIANLVAYSMDVSPVEPLPVDALPYLETPAGYVDFFYRKNSVATDLSYTLKQSTDLVTPDWQSVVINSSTVTETDMGDIDSARLFRIRIENSSLSTLTFFRLEIETDDPP